MRYATAVALVSLLVGGGSAQAFERVYLKKSEDFCDSERVLCLRGSITYEPNFRVLSLRARVIKQTGPGEIRLYFSGTNRQDHASSV